MKRILLALLLIPVMCEAQMAELSVKGGVVMNTLKGVYGFGRAEQSMNYGGTAALTFGLPAGFRVGLALSAYEVKVNDIGPVYDQNGDRVGNWEKSTFSLGTPLVPLEALLMKRFNIGRIRLDIGGVGGMSLNRTMRTDYETDKYDREGTDTNTWFTAGVLLGAQYRLGCRWAIGVEGQAKSILISNNTLSTGLYPVMAKVSYSL